MRYLLILLTVVSIAHAAVTPQGTGVIYGDNHVFSVTAPEGWVLDTDSAAQVGVHAVFYDKDTTWDKAEAASYARARDINKEVKTIKMAVAHVIADFKKNGSPEYKGAKVKEIKNKSGKAGQVYHFSGDQWGNYEAVCYFKEEKTINFVVLTCRNKKAFDAALKSFDTLCKSYLYINDHYNDKVLKELTEAKLEEPTEVKK